MASRRKRNLQFLPAEPRPEAALDLSGLPIDIGVGELMRLSRERQGHELQTVANQLRIRLGYLEAIEEGRFRDLPGTTYAVGFVRSYADYLGLDSADIVRRFREEAARIHGTTKLVFPTLNAEGKVPRGAVLMLSAIGLALAYGAWYYLSSRDAVELPRIADVPDRLVALAPDEGSAPPASPPAANVPPPAAATPEPPAGGATAVPLAAGSAIAAPSPASPAPASPAIPDTNATAAAGSPGEATPVGEGDDIPPDNGLATGSEPPVPLPSPSTAGAADATGAAGAAAQSRSAANDTPGLSAAAIPSAAAAAPSAPPTPAAGSGPDGIPAAPAPPAAESPPTQEAALPAGADKGIVLEARIDSWVKIVDSAGRVVFSQILRAGDHYVLPNEPGLTLDTGNAGGLDVLVDGSKAPPLGEVGAVRHRIVLDPARLRDGTATSE